MSAGRRFAVWCAALTIGGFLVAIDAGAVGKQNHYAWEKEFRVTAGEYGGGFTRIVEAEFLVHAWARNPGNKSSVMIPTSNENKQNYDPYGKEFWKSMPYRSVYNTGKNTIGGVRLDPLLAPVPQGAPYSATVSGTTATVPSWATASSTVSVAPWTVGDRWVSGKLEVEGEAHAVIPRPKGQAYAFSYAGIRLNGKTRAWLAGRVYMKNNKLYRPKRGSGDMRRFVRDPVYFKVYDDLTGEVLAEDDLFDMTMEFWDTEGLPASEYDWENDLFTIDATSAEVHMSLNPLYADELGTLDLVISDGIVSVSDDTGLFDGLLPTIGTASPFSFALPNELEFGYSLGDFGGRAVSVDLNNTMEGQAYVELVPEPIATLLAALALTPLALRRQPGRRPRER